MEEKLKKDIEEFYEEDEEFYTKKDLEQDRFYKMDKNLFNNSKYKGLSLGAKVVFSVLKDRQSLSESNQDDWLDEKNRIFFYFDCVKLSKLLEISTSTLNRHKKELEDYNLLFQFRQGQGKPNRMYCKKPKDIDNALISQNDKSRKVKMTKLELSKRLTNDTEFNYTEYSETESNTDFYKKSSQTFYDNCKHFLNSINITDENLLSYYTENIGFAYKTLEYFYHEFYNKLGYRITKLTEEQEKFVSNKISDNLDSFADETFGYYWVDLYLKEKRSKTHKDKDKQYHSFIQFIKGLNFEVMTNKANINGLQLEDFKLIKQIS